MAKKTKARKAPKASTQQPIPKACTKALAEATKSARAGMNHVESAAHALVERTELALLKNRIEYVGRLFQRAERDLAAVTKQLAA